MQERSGCRRDLRQQMAHTQVSIAFFPSVTPELPGCMPLQDVGRFRIFGASMAQMPGWSMDLQHAAALGAHVWQLWQTAPGCTPRLRKCEHPVTPPCDASLWGSAPCGPSPAATHHPSNDMRPLPCHGALVVFRHCVAPSERAPVMRWPQVSLAGLHGWRPT